MRRLPCRGGDEAVPESLGPHGAGRYIRAMVLVEARVLGKRRALIPEWSVPVPAEPQDDGEGGLTLRALIERIVRAEVSAFEKRQEARRFVRVLSEREIAVGRRRGRIDPGERDVQQEVDPEQAVATALQGFEDGLYLVILDGNEQKDLDRQVHVTDESRLVFLRLTFLAGG
ncbi:MAG: hypothetical protein ACE5F1_18230 [Planctomycetota bacterium]